MIKMNKRFSRQAKIGWWDQRKISNTNVVLVGCGGIGIYTALQLTMLGIRKIVLIDMDTVDESNLNRQMFYESDIDRNKVDALKDKLQAIYSKIKVETYNQAVETVPKTVFENVSFVFDCLDNIETREYLAELCWKKKLPFIHSACSPVIGEVQLIIPGKTKPMREYPEAMKKEEDNKKCEDFDPAVCTTNMIVASLQVDKFLDYLIRKDSKKPFTSYIRGRGLSYGD